jgi:hypothetical protein
MIKIRHTLIPTDFFQHPQAETIDSLPSRLLYLCRDGK